MAAFDNSSNVWVGDEISSFCVFCHLFSRRQGQMLRPLLWLVLQIVDGEDLAWKKNFG